MTYKDKIKELRNGAQETQAAIKIKDKLAELKAKNNSISSYRWIWELIQNAKDCTNSTGIIDIEIMYNRSAGVLEFKHNGKLFSTKNIVYLVEQVSTKERTRESKSTGKFGTGFLTTHLLSSKVSVSGYLYDEGDEFPATFCVGIDRSSDELDEIKESIKKSCEQLESTTTPCYTAIDENQMNTIFKYELDEEGIKAAENGLSNFIITAPYVFAFVSELNKITIIYNGKTTEYTRKKEGETQTKNTFVSRIFNSTSDKIINIFSIARDGIMLAVEIEQRGHKNHIVRYNSNLPKIFCDFPLLGTNDFSFPVVINSPFFNPTEPRNGIFLADNESEQNKELIAKACELYSSLISYFIENNYQDIHNIVIIPDATEKDWIDINWYDEEILSLLKSNISNLPLFHMCDNTTRSLGADEWDDTIYLLKDDDREIRESVWRLSSQLFPEKHIRYCDIDNWYNSLWSECRNYGVLDLIENVEQFGNLEALSKKVADPIKWINELIDLLYNKCKDDYSISNRDNQIFPNQNGNFCCIKDLKKDSGIDEAYKQAALCIDLDLKEELLDTRINFPKICIMSFDDAVNQMNNSIHQYNVNKADFYKLIIGMQCKANMKQNDFIKVYNKLYSYSPINVVYVNKVSQRLLDSALDYWCEEICRKITEYKSVPDIELFENFNDENEIELWISDLVQYTIISEKTEWLEKYAIIPNQKGILKKKSELCRDTEALPGFLKIACNVAGKDIQDEFASLAVDVSKVIIRKKGYKDVADIITNYVRNNKNKISLVGEEKQAFNETSLWLRAHKDDSKINCYFDELMQHLYWFYNDEEISDSFKKATEYDSILQKFGISDSHELEEILRQKNNEKPNPTIITESFLCQYGIDSEEDLKQLIEGKILGEEFIHNSESDIAKYEYVQRLLRRSHDRILEHLKTIPEYDLNDSIDVHKTIFTAKKNDKEIYIIARPSDYDQVILYYGAEIDTLDYSQDFELWVENGISEPQKLTFGRILRLTGVNRIPLRSIRNND